MVPANLTRGARRALSARIDRGMISRPNMAFVASKRQITKERGPYSAELDSLYIRFFKLVRKSRDFPE